MKDKINTIITGIPDKTEKGDLGVTLSLSQFSIFKNGIWSSMMEEKWNIFVMNSTIYFARSWTNIIVYLVYYKETPNNVLLESFEVNKDENQYSFKNIDEERDRLTKLIKDFADKKIFYMMSLEDAPCEVVIVKIGKLEKKSKSENGRSIQTYPTDVFILFERNSENIKIKISVYFNKDGQLILDGYDTGKDVETYWGTSDYEYGHTIEASELDKLYKAFGDKLGVLKSIYESFRGNEAYSRFGKFLDENKIDYS